MSPSSAGSWERAPDIIDLDRYMRGGVRPSDDLSDEQSLCEQLVVDGGGVGRAGGGAGGGGYKRHSHDSGVSDGSYDTRAHRRSRRVSYTDGRAHAPRFKFSARTFNGLEHSDSLRDFRTVCERALLDQQKQIAHVAQLCEWLTERAGDRLANSERFERSNERLPGRNSERLERLSERLSERPPERVSERFIERVAERPPERILERLPERFSKGFQQLPDTPERILSRSPERLPEKLSERLNSLERPVERPLEKMRSDRSELTRPKRVETDRAVSDTSDISSSSRSTKDLRRKEKDRTQECKTYKIIMTKLDELNNRFRPGPSHPSYAPSSSSVSVCDKLVATDPVRTTNRIVRPSVQIHYQASARPPAAASASPTRPRVVAQAYNVDIAPRSTGNNPNVATESVVKCESSRGSGTSVDDPRCNFDLEDPVHLYSQAKRLQALNASTRHTRSHSSAEPHGSARDACAEPLDPRPGGAEGKEGTKRPRSPSLCSVCRGYWRSLRQYLLGSFTQDCKCS